MIQDTVALLAGFFLMISFIPQIMQSHKTKKLNDVSVVMILLVLIGAFFFALNGLLTNNQPVLLMNAFLGITVLYLLFLKLKHTSS